MTNGRTDRQGQILMPPDYCHRGIKTLVESLNKTCTRYKMEISAEEINLMINSSNAIQREIKLKGQKLGTVTSFIKYLRAVVPDHGSKP